MEFMLQGQFFKKRSLFLFGRVGVITYLNENLGVSTAVGPG